MSISRLLEIASRSRKSEIRKRVFTGATIGIAVGIAAGILLAPKSGKQTRQELTDAARQLPDKAKELAELSKTKFAAVKEKLHAKKSANAETTAHEEDKFNADMNTIKMSAAAEAAACEEP